eukprot:1080232-Ditylum_brightwellii.AAC.1
MEGFHGPHRTKRRASNHGHAADRVVQISETAQHGSLLIIGDMLDHTGDFMLPRFDEVCRAVLDLSKHPKALVRLEVIRLMPRLARRCPGVFGRRYLTDGLNFLIESAGNPTPPRVGIDLRPAAFFSIGQLALAMSGREIDGVGSLTVRIISNEDGSEENASKDLHTIEHKET